MYTDEEFEAHMEAERNRRQERSKWLAPALVVGAALLVLWAVASGNMYGLLNMFGG